MTVKEMLDALREFYHLKTLQKFADFFGISSVQNASSWYSRDTIDAFRIYEKTKDDISPDWLLSMGEGEMLRSAAKEGRDISALKSPDIDYVPYPALDKTLTALHNEQEISRKSQEQIGSLISIMDKTLN